MAFENLWSRVWRGLGLPTRVLYGHLPTILADEQAGASGEPSSLPSVLGCISVLADQLVASDWRIVQGDGATAKPVRNAAARALAGWPLHDRWAWAWGGLYSGNGTALVLRNAAGDPTGLTTYPAERVALLLMDDGRLRYQLVPISGGNTLEVAESEIVALRYRPSGRDPRIGISPLLQASPTVTMLLASRSATTSTMLNASRPSGVLQTAGKLDPERASALAERWRSVYGGPGNAGRIAVLEQGLEWKSIEVGDLVKLAAVETARLGVEDVCRIFSVPTSIMLSTDANRSSSQEDRRRLLAFGVAPLARLIEDALSSVLLTERERENGLRASIDLTRAALGSGKEAGETLSLLVNGGIASPNEARALLGLPGVTGGDQLRAPSNTFPLGHWLGFRPAGAAQDEPPARARRFQLPPRDAVAEGLAFEAARMEEERLARVEAERIATLMRSADGRRRWLMGVTGGRMDDMPAHFGGGPRADG